MAQLLQDSDKLLRQPGELDTFATLYTDDAMTAAEFLGSVVDLARNRLEEDGIDAGAAYAQVIFEVAMDFPAVVVAALTDYDDNHQSEDFLIAMLAKTQATLVNDGRSRPRRLDA